MYIISFLIGLISILISWSKIFGLVVAILALLISIFSTVIKKNNSTKWMGRAGFVYSIIAVIISLSVIFIDANEPTRRNTMSLDVLSSAENYVLNSYDNKTISGVQVKGFFSQFIKSNSVTIVLVDSYTGNILATAGESAISSEDIIKKDDYYEIQNDKYIADNGVNHKVDSEEIYNLNIDAYKEYNTYLLKRVSDSGGQYVVGLVIENR